MAFDMLGDITLQRAAVESAKKSKAEQQEGNLGNDGNAKDGLTTHAPSSPLSQSIDQRQSNNLANTQGLLAHDTIRALPAQQSRTLRRQTTAK